MKFKISFGSDQVDFNINDDNLPKELPLIVPRKGKFLAESSDIESCITKALEHPVNSSHLRSMVCDQRVALTVSDEFRSGQQEMILKCLLTEIAAGCPSEVWIFCATGSHDPQIYAVHIKEWVEKYAKECGLNFKFFANDCMGKSFVDIGKCSDGTPVLITKELLECRVRVYGHESKHHYMNGYSCLDKQILPGLAARRSIESNHKNALDDVHSVGGRNVWVGDPKRKNNPFSLGCSEARKLADSSFIDERGVLEKVTVPTFALDMISDAKNIYWIAAGDPNVIIKMMPAEVDRIAAFDVEPTKYIIISPGGPPASQTLYSTQNCFDMALSGAITDKGEALIIAPCEGRPDVPESSRGLAPDEKAKKLFYDNLVEMKDWPLPKSTSWIKNNFELYLWKTDRVLKLMNKRKIKLFLYSTLPDDKVLAAGFIPVKDIQEWIDERTKKRSDRIRVIDDGNKLLVMPKV